MLTVLIGLSSAIVFGAADFLGGLASKRINPMRVTAIASAVGFLLLVAALPILGGTWSWPAVWLGALSGVTGAIAIALLYACLAIGPMSILSPLTAVVSAIVPLTVGLIGGERLQPIGYLALGIALVAVVLVGFVPTGRDEPLAEGELPHPTHMHAVRPSLRGVAMAIGSGIAIGAFLIVIDLTPDDSGLVPLVVNRATNASIMLAAVGAVALVARRRARVSGAEVSSSGWRAGLALAIACGLIDATANVGLLLGIRLGELSVMAVLTALYPAGTIILAAIVLKERIAWLQYVGLALALIAAAMLALA